MHILQSHIWRHRYFVNYNHLHFTIQTLQLIGIDHQKLIVRDILIAETAFGANKRIFTLSGKHKIRGKVKKYIEIDCLELIVVPNILIPDFGVSMAIMLSRRYLP